MDEPICKAEIDTNVEIPQGKEGGKNWETEIDTYTLLILCVKETTNENIPYSTGNST